MDNKNSNPKILGRKKIWKKRKSGDSFDRILKLPLKVDSNPSNMNFCFYTKLKKPKMHLKY